jgi:hypothetical protein
LQQVSEQRCGICTFTRDWRFASINQFSVAGFDTMVKAANALIAELAPS